MQAVITGGGVLRDHDGNLIAGFSKFYGLGTNTLAEMMALGDGLRCCIALGFDQVMVESDSLIVVGAIRSGKIDNWKLEYIFRECRMLFSSATFDIVHGFQQKNQVADRLAAEAHVHTGVWIISELRAFLAKSVEPSTQIE